MEILRNIVTQTQGEMMEYQRASFVSCKTLQEEGTGLSL